MDLSAAITPLFAPRAQAFPWQGLLLIKPGSVAIPTFKAAPPPSWMSDWLGERGVTTMSAADFVV
ncbi:MAG: hypothetical protein ACK55X_09385 [Synechococcaceae cyanobacterium]|jgi:hypothetical protein